MPNTANESTRERIRSAAIELIAEVGADRLRTRAVAERADVNPALVHYYFGSMAELVTDAVEAVVADETQPFLNVLRRSPGIPTAVRSMFDELENASEPTPQLMVLMDLMFRSTRDAATRARTKDMLAGFRELIHDWLTEAQRRGEIRPDVDVSAATIMLAGLLDGLGMHRLIDPDLDVGAVAGPVLAALAGADDGSATTTTTAGDAHGHG